MGIWFGICIINKYICVINKFIVCIVEFVNIFVVCIKIIGCIFGIVLLFDRFKLIIIVV